MRNTVQMARLRSPRLSTRVALFFGLIGLLAGLGLTTATYSIARDSLLDQRVSAARSSAFDNALAVKNAFDQALLPSGGLDSKVISDSFLTLDVEPGGFSMLTRPYIPLFLQFPASAFPTELLDSVERTQSGQQRFVYDGEPYLGIGVHIAAYDTSYVEAFPLGSTERTLRIIVTALLIGSVLAALFATFFGFTTSRGLLKPLTRVADAAGDIAQGALDARLDNSDDPELDRLVRSFNDMADAVQARIEREARFASDVSHELRSPITAMTAAVEVLAARRDELGDRSRQALDLLVEQVRRFDSMVIDLLELSRLDAGAVDGHAEELDLVEWAERVASRSATPEVPIEVERGAPRRAVVDKVRLERILGNLLENAAHHAGGATRVSIEPGDRVGTLLLAVEDEGPGVAASERERIFERFARGSAARHRVGTGLGLALVAEHAAAMGGEAWVDDRPYGGSRFVVRLPRDRSEITP
ncbi:MAG: HAMP domain-containing sensor histidine kinase [Actinobacteria bacterium]|nr:HAMP domain-containing sensor histidine kinase [Actinomycetota bacterium]